MNRELKFRIWDGIQWSYFVIGQMWTDWMQSVYSDHCLNGRKFFQYTGLKDKNGKEIYEGDIVLFNRSSYMAGNFEAEGVIEWYYHKYQWKRLAKYDGDENNGIWPTADIFACPTWLEVIGNIYENPELIRAVSV